MFAHSRPLQRPCAMTTVSTPCTKVCTVDAESRHCVGCGRNLDEIALWLSLSEDDRRQIMAELPARLRRLAAARAAAAAS
jgi:predicted Fe-S protein YdhL (DUF1289 family)